MNSTLNPIAFDRILRMMRDAGSSPLDLVFESAMRGRSKVSVAEWTAAADARLLYLVRETAEAFEVGIAGDLTKVARELMELPLSLRSRTLLASAVLAVPHGLWFGAAFAYSKSIMRFILEENEVALPLEWYDEDWDDEWFDCYKELKTDDGSFKLFLGGKYWESESWLPPRASSNRVVNYPADYRRLAKASRAMRRMLARLWLESRRD